MGELIIKIGVISDIHSNYHALTNVLNFLEGKIDNLICGGDFVGYGPQPQESINAFLDYPFPIYLCLGNHDLGVRYKYSCRKQNPLKLDHKILKTFNFRETASEMLERNAKEIKKEHFDFLLNLPFKQIFQIDQTKFYLTHGTPSVRRTENVGKYLLPPPLQHPEVTTSRLKNDKKAEEAEIIVVGHTHRRFLIKRDKFSSWSLIDDILNNKPTKFPLKFTFHKDRIIFNPGSVGQPRDGTGNASFCILDLDGKTIEFNDLEYQMEDFYKLTKRKGVPEVQNSSFWANKLGHFSKRNRS
ncbi:MAG: metallophosphoesterase family protein [Candidatus Heimdallarchaeota archaeon]|nr:MAG: metallophosphoesterase family protein [Candidatus Heimdallarchaeota archaeon]